MDYIALCKETGMGKTYSNVALKVSFNETKVVGSVGVGEGRRGGGGCCCNGLSIQRSHQFTSPVTNEIIHEG